MATDTYLSGTYDPRFEGVREVFAANFTQRETERWALLCGWWQTCPT
jgi:hypothetical protein